MRQKIIIPAAIVLVLLAGLYILGRSRTQPKESAISPTGEVVVETVTPGVTGREQQGTGGGLAESTSLPLEITSPQNGATVSSSSITVSGKTAPNIQVFVNEKELVADANGNFSTTIELFEGENTIFVVANNNVGDYVEKQITVNLESTQ